MPAYEYPRKLKADGSWDVNNNERLDAMSKQTRLAKEIESALSGHRFLLRCSGDVTLFLFETGLMTAEKSILDKLVGDHQKNL